MYDPLILYNCILPRQALLQAERALRALQQPPLREDRPPADPCRRADCAVKMKYRAVYVNGQKTDLSFRDVRALPTNVKAHEGLWFLDNGDLNVVFRTQVGKESAV
ncbi:unnamed protein product, partial [Iphiclides podalirius]